jgi:antitoxin component HigA of HigAB toxin-antitoxin module
MIGTTLKFANLPVTYAELVAMYPPRPLHDRIDQHNVEEIVAAMAGHDLTPDQDDYLDLLSDLLLKFQSERQGRTRARRSPLQRLRFLLEESQTNSRQLAEVLGCSQPLVSLILSGKRQLTTANIRKLAAHFRLDAGYFI